MTLDQIRTIINTISGDKGRTQILRPEQFNLIAGFANVKHFRKKVGLPHEYMPGQPVPREAYEINKLSSVDLAPFKVHMGKDGEMPMRVDANGYADVPSDMYYPSTMSYQSTGYFIDILSDQEWVRRHDDALTKPTARYPVANLQSGYFRFSPIVNTFVEFVYLRFPKEPHYAYTTANGFIEYDAGNSVEFEWNDANLIDIIMYMLTDLGFKMERADVIEYAEKVKQQGT